MKQLYKVLITMLMVIPFLRAEASGWPANYEGVMLQGFYWDSYSDTKWTNLEKQSDELSQYFDLIWVPNSGYCGSTSSNMGYMPQYWFTNHKSAFGTEAELRSMIKTFKAKGTGIIEDVVVNHRNGVTNWYDFPVEQWNGTTWKIGLEGICKNDEMANASGQPKPTGNYDTGDNFDGCRDLDHTNANVQNNVKNYCKFLLEDLGYTGFRYDMVKGYGPQYTKMYNEYSKPQFSVGEFWDDSYDAVAWWIEGTGKTSAAFDFPCKNQINKAFNNGENLQELVWNANGTTPQPAGMIHYGYSQYAVTFVGNHDTERDGNYSHFYGNVPAANAFILSSPGTPCVYLEHWKKYKDEIKKLIEARKAVGLHNNSPVTVLKTANNIYMAEVTGTKGKLVVKIGSEWGSGADASYGEPFASGEGYCVWIKTEGGVTPTPTPTPSGEAFTVYFDNSSSKWATPYIHYWGTTESTWPGVAMTNVSGDVWSYTVPAGTEGLLFNAGDGDPTKTSDFTAIANHIYNTSGDQGVYNGNSDNNQGNGNDDSNTTDDKFTVYFDNSSSKWATPYIHYWGESESSWPGVAMTNVSGDVWSYAVPAGTTGLLFNAGDGDPTKTSDFTAIANHIYNTSGDLGVYNEDKDDPVVSGDPFTVYYDNTNTGWDTPYIYFWGGQGCSWPGVPMAKVGQTRAADIWSYTVPAGTTGIIFNAGDGDPTKTDDFDAVANHVYNHDGDMGEYNPDNEDKDNPVVSGDPFTVYYDNTDTGWDIPYIHYWGGEESTWPGVPMNKIGTTRAADIWSYTVPAGTKGILFNAGDGDVSKTDDFDAVANHVYNREGDMGEYVEEDPEKGDEQDPGQGDEEDPGQGDEEDPGKGDEQDPGQGDVQDPDDKDEVITENLYIIGNIEGCQWSTSSSPLMERDGNVFTGTYTLVTAEGETMSYFSFTSSLGADWDELNSKANRYGAASNNAPAVVGENTLTLYANGVNASGCQSFGIAPGTYTFTVDISDLTLTISAKDENQGDNNPGEENPDAGVEGIEAEEIQPIYFNLQGIQVQNPAPGLYIKVTGKNREKVMIR